VGRIKDKECHGEISYAFTVDPSLMDEFGLEEYILKLFWSNILTLRQLENILDPIYNLDRPITLHFSNIASEEPTILHYRLSSLLWILKIALHD
jgi:hypothetical protein